MRKKRFMVLVLVAVVALSAILAYFLGGVNKEPKADYSWLVGEMQANKEAQKKGMYGFVLVEPQRAHHIADPLTVRFGAIYDPGTWEISQDMFRTAVPLPGAFEVRDRQVRTAKIGHFSVIETVLLVQCLVCRDGVYNVSFGLGEFLAKNREEGGSTAIPLSSSRGRMEFIPLTDSGYRVDDELIRLPSPDDEGTRVLFLALAGACFLVAVGLLLHTQRLRQDMLAGRFEENQERRPRYLVRIKGLIEELGRKEAGDLGHSLYTLLLAYREEYGDAANGIGEILDELGEVYSKEGISEEALRKLLDRAGALIQRGGIKWSG